MDKYWAIRGSAGFYGYTDGKIARGFCVQRALVFTSHDAALDAFCTAQRELEELDYPPDPRYPWIADRIIGPFSRPLTELVFEQGETDHFTVFNALAAIAAQIGPTALLQAVPEVFEAIVDNRTPEVKQKIMEALIDAAIIARMIPGSD